MKTLSERFWEKVATGPSCWLWQGCKNAEGYGRFTTVGKRVENAHRVAYKLTRGYIPEGMVVRHSCDNPSCVNPDHLLIGTHADNSADKVARKRHGFGETNAPAKLTEAQVRGIKADPRSNAAAAKAYSVSPTLVSNIRNGKRWRHLEECVL